MVKSHTYIVHGSENMVHVIIDLGRSLNNIVHGSRKITEIWYMWYVVLEKSPKYGITITPSRNTEWLAGNVKR